MAKKIMVAMSGGVDSSVSALLLKEAGWDAVGVTMCFGKNKSSVSKKRPSCCSIDGIEDAKKVARQLKMPHYVLNFSRALEENVIEDFISEYLCGRTPNPCVRCNQHLKFGILLEKAKGFGFPYIATGHFVQKEKIGRDIFLKKGIDSKKDQSYFLCQVRPNVLSKVMFPVGGMTKQEVRDFAKKKGLPVAEKSASQEICFIPGNDYRQFLGKRLNRACYKQGNIIDLTGKILAKHNGIFNFTVGQREGLGISAPHPLYVLKLDGCSNAVVVGEKDKVYSGGLIASGVNLFSKNIFRKSKKLKSKIRYNHPEADAVIKQISRGKLSVDFLIPQAAITPGQFVVFYKDDLVLGGAKIIERTNNAKNHH